ncbi:MAG: TfoX/Sxy family protein [Acidimicrobiales bacterium]
MAFEDELAGRIRGMVAGEQGLTERRMFGGLAFLVGGHMAIAASGDGGVLVRVDPSTGNQLVNATSAVPAVMRGRPLAGWLRVASSDLAADAELARWVDLGVSYARSLPPK